MYIFIYNFIFKYSSYCSRIIISQISNKMSSNIINVNQHYERDDLSKLLSQIQSHLTQYKFNIDPTEALNSLIYGIPAFRIKNGKTKRCMIFQLDKNIYNLSIAFKNETKIEFLNLTGVSLITFSTQTENMKGIKTVFTDRVINFLIDQKTVDFAFDSRDQLLTFMSGIQELLHHNKEQPKDLGIDDYIKKLWIQVDKDFSGYLDRKEFKLFSKTLGSNVDYKSLFDVLDIDNDNKINYNEFISYFKRFTSGEEFTDLFNKYQNGDGFITAKGLQNFFKENQKENITEREATEMILFFSKGVKLEEKKTKIEEISNLYKQSEIEGKPVALTKEQIDLLHMDLSEFKELLYSNIASILDQDKINKPLNMNRPINDYFINSTHNTYLTGHQLAGKSSVNMYSFAMLEGYRLVEMDCYDGKGDDIIITHGYTLASDIKLKDVLVELKKTAFVNSNLPVVLSIENHMDKHHQNVMANDFKTILQDLYIFPSEHPPDHLPNLKEMCNKFIVKCGGKRFPKDRSKITSRSKLTYKSDNELSSLGMKSLFINRFGDLMNQKLLTNKNVVDDVTDNDNDVEIISLVRRGKQHDKSLLTNEGIDANERKQLIQVANENQNALFKDIIQGDDDEPDYKEEANTETETELGKVRGFHGTKFKLDKIKETNYQPWEFVTIKSTKFESFCKNFETRRTITEFNQNALMKAYPQSFNSANYNPIHCWIMGCHVASMNIQATDDDYLLCNKIFFKQNQNCGYVLKPKKLLPESTYIEIYDKPVCSIHINIHSLVNVARLVQNEKKKLKRNCEMKLSCYVIGTNEDEEHNRKFTFNVTGNLLFPTINDNSEFIFEIYEKDLSCIMFKLFYEGSVVGRMVVPVCMMKEGIRNIPFYSSKLEKQNFSFLIVQTKITNV